VTQSALSLIARLREAGATLEYLEGRGVRFEAVKTLPAALLAEARQHRDEISRELSAKASAAAASTASGSGIASAQGIDVDGLVHDPDPLVDQPTSHDERTQLLRSEIANWHPRWALTPPPSWWHEEVHRPAPGAVCSCCGGVRWWSRDGKGWCCQACHPKIGLAGAFLEFSSSDELRDRIVARDMKRAGLAGRSRQSQGRCLLSGKSPHAAGSAAPRSRDRGGQHCLSEDFNRHTAPPVIATRRPL
jgi:hypothetical protein